MRSARSSGTNSPLGGSSRKSRFQLLFWAALFSALVGAIGLGEPIEDLLRDVRNVVREHPASGEIVLVAIDDRSLDKIGKWPWSRSYHAALVNNLREAGAKNVYFDIDFSFAADPQGDEAFRKALARGNKDVMLAARVLVDPSTGERSDLIPIQPLREEVELININVKYNYRGEVRRLPYDFKVAGMDIPSMAARLAGESRGGGEYFPIDFAISPRSVPVISAADVLHGDTDRLNVAGKSVVIGTTSARLGDIYPLPGHGVMTGVFLQILGAETLLAGTPILLGWLTPLLVAIALAGGILRVNRSRYAAGYLAATAAIFILVPVALEDQLIFPEIVPCLLFLLAVSGVLAWSDFKRFYSARGSTNAISGLPNLNVLRQQSEGQKTALAVAKVHNYAEISSALSSQGEEMLVRQIAHRLSLISLGSTLYQSDEGIFAWFPNSEISADPAEHFNAAFEIFRSPLLVLGSQVDTTITFGIDLRTDQPLAGRLGSALVAADKALGEGLRWKQYDQSQSEDLAWRLSLLSQLDQAIDAGDLWIAFQPKLDLATRKIIGAEALARWDHPEKGSINPIDFILAAEQSGRIGKLTDYVLERSIEAAAKVNRQEVPFNVAVNLSARLIDGMTLTATVSRLLSRYGLPPKCLTLEITETAALAGGGRDLDILKDLRKLGVQLSIDDYGTGLSTLDYLKRIPATEIKIDKSFIEAIEKSRSDRLMVHSTIQLAHSLGQKVVAEGVERPETLEMLALMGCDIAQGYLIGRPVPIEELENCVLTQQRAA